MKKLYLVLLFVSTMLAGFSTKSQNRERFPILRERIAQAKLHEIQSALKLDQAAFNQFRPVYMRYEKELSGIDFRKMAKLLSVDADSLSVDEADQLIVNQIEGAKSLIDVREKYYREFRKILSPQQIIRLYQTEAEIRKKVMKELKRRLLDRQ